MSEQMAPQTVGELRAAMERGLADLLAALDGLSDERQLGPRDEAGWNVRDHVVHMAVWADGVAALLHREDRWAAMGLTIEDGEADDIDYDLLNEQIANRHRGLAPAEARAWLVAAHGRLAEAVAGVGDAGLGLPYERYVAPFTGDGGSPVAEYIAGNSYDHYDEHTPWILALAAG